MVVSRQADFKKAFVACTDAHTPPELHVAVRK